MRQTSDNRGGRAWVVVLLVLAGFALLVIWIGIGVPFVGRGQQALASDLVVGRRGLSAGRFQKPRAMARDEAGNLYVVDMTARIQVFDAQGKYLRGWRTPEWAKGKPTGLSIDRQGHLRVPDTHYHRVLEYTASGRLLRDRTFGGKFGSGPGEFGFVTDWAEDSEGNVYVSEYGENDRIQKFSADGVFLMSWGHRGSRPGEFQRPQAIKIDEQDHVWVADACNHRIQVFDATGAKANLLQFWGSMGTADGQLRYPYDLLLTKVSTVLVCEFGNSRIQEFLRDGKWVRTLGRPGRMPGEFHSPWAIEAGDAGTLWVLDTYNHRIQRVSID